MAYTAKSSPSVAPDKGSFPLDHDGACKQDKTNMLQCLRDAQGDNNKCRVQSLAYLQCRMDNGLMAQESLDKLGYAASQSPPNLNDTGSTTADEHKSGTAPTKERTGFVGGLSNKPLPKKD
ncbi:hypothetical protein BASA81_000400 [Batrachochytrium salamandrivorans]|nr:hypothetical protein BASA81_000400 [Batrachochytrium salamandrivorans]